MTLKELLACLDAGKSLRAGAKANNPAKSGIRQENIRMTLNELLAYLDGGNALRKDTEAMALMCHYSEEARKILPQLNGSFHDQPEIARLMSLLTGVEVDPGFRLFTPFYTDFGKNIRFGKNVFVNFCCCFQDQGGIRIGDNVLVGHRVTIATLNHDLDPASRGDLHPAPVIVGDNVWIGADVTICPGARIGDNAVIGAGAVVLGEVPANAIVAGVPAKFIRKVPGAAR